jgi:chromatin remodeling complex protein RSC6
MTEEKKNSAKEKKNSAFMKPLRVSEDLAIIVGRGPMPRTEVAKKLWDYIKKHKLQDPKNKRNIIPDQNLARVFGSSTPINMFKMTSKVSAHLTDPELASSHR